MKNFTRTSALILISGRLCLLSTPSLASEARVDSAGGLTTIMSDETTDLDLFLDGNPAGLVLLKRQDRVDLAGQWFYSNRQTAGTDSVQQTFSTTPRLSGSDPIPYEGLIVFPEPQWAFQASADYWDPQSQPVYGFDSFSIRQYRSLLRAAYDPGPLALGLEILNVQTDKQFDQGLYDPPGLNAAYFGIDQGNSGQNQTFIRAGLIAQFPQNAPEDQARWQVGGYTAVQLSPAAERQTLDLFTTGSGPFEIVRTTTTTDNFSFVPEVLYEVPDRLILKFSCAMNDWDQDFSQDIPAGVPTLTSISNFQAMRSQSLNAIGEFRVMEPVNDKEILKIGGSLAFLSDSADQYFYGSQSDQRIETSLGIGLESLYDYLFGIQFRSWSYLNNSPINSFTAGTLSNNYDGCQLVFGGEKWLSSNWAFRLGLILQDGVYSQWSGQQDLNTSIVGGLGYESLFWKMDLKLQAGQTIDVNDTSNLSTQTGVELSGTLFL